MGRRSICSIGILLLCIVITSCNKSDNINLNQNSEGQDNRLENDMASDRKEEPESDVTQEAGESMDENVTDTKETFQVDTLIGDTQMKDIIEEILLSKLLLKAGGPETLKEQVSNYASGTVLITDGLKDAVLTELFYSEKLSEDIKTRITGKSYGNNCDIPYSELRYIRVLYKDFEGRTKIGELIVNQSIAEDTVEIFKELYAADYPIERMVLLDEYNADDIASMEANNTSAFNYRNVEGTTNLSQHSYGLAIDINPVYNPYIRVIEGKTVVLPAKGIEHTDRSKDYVYYIKDGEICFKTFTDRGFTWGGDWTTLKDYQHFQKTPAK